ncbi:MAG: four helix bundle protein [Terriglobales bacterium]
MECAALDWASAHFVFSHHTRTVPEGERPEVVTQLQRAAASIPCNIAEGGRKVVCGREPCRLVTGITQLRRVRRWWQSVSSCW